MVIILSLWDPVGLTTDEDGIRQYSSLQTSLHSAEAWILVEQVVILLSLLDPVGMTAVEVDEGEDEKDDGQDEPTQPAKC